MEKDILYLASWMCSNNVAGYHISWAFVETEGTASRLRQAGSEQNGNCLLISISVLNFEALDLGAKSSPLGIMSFSIMKIKKLFHAFKVLNMFRGPNFSGN